MWMTDKDQHFALRGRDLPFRMSLTYPRGSWLWSTSPGSLKPLVQKGMSDQISQPKKGGLGADYPPAFAY